MEPSPFEAIQSRSVRIGIAEGARAHIDGGTAEVPAGTEILIRVIPSAINMLTGAGTHLPGRAQP